MSKKFLTEAEFKTFLEAAKKSRNGVRDYCLMMMIFRHGLRASEAVDVRFSDLDLDSGQIYVRRLKGGLSTNQPIEGDEIRAIKAWIRERGAHAMAHSDYLFLSERGPMRREALNYQCEVISERAGLGFKVNPHMLRHSCGFALANKNTATRTIQDFLGHRSIANTVIYTAANSNRFRNIWSNRK